MALETEWMTDANCIGIDVESFFAPLDTRQYRDATLLTKTCDNCGVAVDCRDYALKYNVNGWWSNTTEASRERMRKQLNIIPIPMLKDL